MLTLVEAIILGTVQGIAEWLPISSEGMTSLVMVNVFGMTLSEAIPLAIWLHIGTLLSAVIYLRQDVMDILRDLPDYVRSFSSGSSHDATITFLIISTLLTGIVGLPLMKFATGFTDFSGALATALIGVLLIATGILQKVVAKGSARKNLPEISDSVIVGVAQGFAALPGISRSGITVSALLLRKYESSKAIRLSFLMSIPTILVAEIGIGLMGLITVDRYAVVALLFAFLFGLLTIDMFLKVAERMDFSNFCIALGLLSVLVLLL
ncbi:MAG: undecaprenyl-diphosphate phosphatase [Methanosarcinaceae archaeon]|nr:undecaprenyl-diphosphate phosphatase [Methanosarcinaceae archaeon]